MAMVRLAVAYDGTAYHGWQIQPDVPTVEGALQRAAARMLDRPLTEVKVQGASRTDAGVHALGQVCHVSYEEREREPWDFVRALNAMTDDDITVIRAEAVDPSFHARHAARGKQYRYRIWNHRFAHPLQRLRCWQVPHRLDLDAVARAAAGLLGTHDFSAFRASDCQATTTVRTLTRVELVAAPGHQGRPMFDLMVEGDRFLKNMVRIIAGTLVDVGRGQLSADDIAPLLQSGERSRGGQTAPPQGLTLMRVDYPDYPWRQAPEVGGPWL